MIYRAFKETHNRQHINYRTNLRKGKKKECNELETKTQNAAAMLAKGTDMLSSTAFVIGRDSTTVAARDTTATF
jgi:hypothetical protein